MTATLLIAEAGSMLTFTETDVKITYLIEICVTYAGQQ